MGTELHLTPFTTGLVTSSLLFGAAFGALLSGNLANAAGRKKIILWLAVLFAIGAISTCIFYTSYAAREKRGGGLLGGPVVLKKKKNQQGARVDEAL